MCPDERKMHPLGSAIRRINEDLYDAVVVLITVVMDEDGEPLSTHSEAMRTIAQADNTLTQPEKYAAKVLQQQMCMLTAQATYKFAIMEYIPPTKEVRQILHGVVQTQSVH